MQRFEPRHLPIQIVALSHRTQLGHWLDRVVYTPCSPDRVNRNSFANDTIHPEPVPVEIENFVGGT